MVDFYRCNRVCNFCVMACGFPSPPLLIHLYSSQSVLICVRGAKGGVFPEGMTVRTWSGLVEQPLPDGPIPDGGEVPDGGEIGAPQRYILWEQNVGLEMATNNTICTKSLMFGQMEGAYEGAGTFCFPAVADGVVQFLIGPEDLLTLLKESCVKIVDVRRDSKRVKPYTQPLYKIEGGQRKRHGERKCYKSYIKYWRGKGVAQEMQFKVKVTDDKAKYVLWWIKDPDDPAGHRDVDPNDKDCKNPYGYGNGNDNTGSGWSIASPIFKIEWKAYKETKKNVKRRSPYFPVKFVKGLEIIVLTKVKKGKSGLWFCPTNDGGDDFAIYAIPFKEDPLKGRRKDEQKELDIGKVKRALEKSWEKYALCNGVCFYVVVWRRVEVWIYAMKKKGKKPKVYYPGARGLLHEQLKRAFGDVEDPDRNCYIEIIPKDINLKTPYKENFRDEDDLHKYTLDMKKRNFHTNKQGGHRKYSAQLLGVRNYTAVGVVGQVPDYPHAFVFNAKRPTKVPLCLAYTLKNFPFLTDGTRFNLYVFSPQGKTTATVVIRDLDGNGDISPDELWEALSTAIRKADLYGLLKMAAWKDEEEHKEDKKVVIKLQCVGISFPQGWRVKIGAVDPEAKQKLLKSGFPLDKEFSYPIYLNHTPIHEVGHVLFSRGKTIPPRKAPNAKKRRGRIADFYHTARYVEPSVSRWEFNSLKFCPLLARYFRCFINAFFDRNGKAYHD